MSKKVCLPSGQTHPFGKLPYEKRKATPLRPQRTYSFFPGFASFKKLQIIRIMMIPIGKAEMMLTD